jgi:hypothetical protein
MLICSARARGRSTFKHPNARSSSAAIIQREDFLFLNFKPIAWLNIINVNQERVGLIAARVEVSSFAESN